MWNPFSSILVKTDWQYTEPITGEYFRLKHVNAPLNSSYLIAQAQLNTDNSVELFDIQELKVTPELQDIYLKIPGVFSDRRIAIKRASKQPTLESELRRVIRDDLFRDSDFGELSARRTAWTIDIEVSDYVEVTPALTPTPSIGGDEFFSNVVLLMHFEGTDNSVVFTDVLAHPFTANGAAKISTAKNKFGSASGSFPGNGTATTPDSEDWNLAASDFTIEAYVYRTGIDAYSSPIVAQWHRGDVAGNSWTFVIEPGSNNLALGISTSGSNDIGVSSGVPVPAFSWIHVAVTREAGILRFWIDGIKAGADTTREAAFFSSALPLAVGGAAFATDQGTEFIGFIDELRITKGKARYSTNFTPPSSSFPNN